VCSTVCRPVYEQHCHKACHQVTKQICEQHCREVCQTVCRPVTEACHKNVCVQVSKCLTETVMKQVCTPVCKDVCETVMKEVCEKVCRPVTTTKCVTKKCGEWVTETYCVPGRTHTVWKDVCETCFDPCTCKTTSVSRKVKVCCEGPSQTKTKKVWRDLSTTEQVPVTTYVSETIRKQVPVTVHRKVQTNEITQVPCTTTRQVRGAYVDDKGVAHETDGPGRTFKEGEIVRKTVTHHVTRMVNVVEKKSIPYTTSRCAKGAYVDDKGVGHATEGPGRNFVEGAKYETVTTTTSCRMVREQVVRKVQYTVCETVMEKQVKKVSYQVSKLVPCTTTKKVCYTVCEQEKFTVTKKVPYTECVTQPYTVNCKVPYTVCENVPCTVTKQVKVCVPETVCVKKARMVPVTVATDPAPCAPAAPCTTPCTTPCKTDCTPSCGSGCDCRPGLLSRLRQRSFASLCSTGCCEQTTTTNCSTPCDPCHSFCREGLLQRLFRNRFACEPTCNTGCTTGGCTTGNCGSAGGCAPSTTVPPAPPVTEIPKSMPKN
jgi:hypothetical protein